MVRRIRKIIAENKNFLILSHKEPDGDSVGSVVALSQAINSLEGKNAVAFYPVEFPERLNFLVEKAGICSELMDDNFDAVFVLDCSSPDRIAGPSLTAIKTRPIINIDHHISNPLFGNLNWVEPNRSSVGEMVYVLFSNIKLPRLALEGIYTAILTDTGKFTYQNVSSKTFAIASKLVALGVEPYAIASKLYFNYPKDFLKKLGQSYVNAERMLDGKVMFITVEMEGEKLGYELETIVELAMLERDILVAVLFIPMGERTKLSLRSKDNLDVGELASYFGGGGHRNASGCVIELPLQQAKKIILEEIMRRNF